MNGVDSGLKQYTQASIKNKSNFRRTKRKCHPETCSPTKKTHSRELQKSWSKTQNNDNSCKLQETATITHFFIPIDFYPVALRDCMEVSCNGFFKHSKKEAMARHVGRVKRVYQDLWALLSWTRASSSCRRAALSSLWSFHFHRERDWWQSLHKRSTK